MSVQNKPTRVSARRCLFGRPNPEAKDEIKIALDEHMKEKINEWGFDFVEDRPLVGGDVDYETLPMEQVPAFYHPKRVRAHVTKTRAVDPAIPSTSVGTSAPVTPVRLTRAAKRKLEDASPDSIPQKQSSITNFVRVMKRRTLKFSVVDTTATSATPAKRAPSAEDHDVESSPFRFLSAADEKKAQFPSSSPVTSPRKSPRKRLTSFSSPKKSPRKTPQKRNIATSSTGGLGKHRSRAITAAPATRSLRSGDKPIGTQ